MREEMFIDPVSPTFSVGVSGATLAYAGRLLFDGLALSLPAGSWTCLLGPSGIGKTSLIRLILGVQTADEMAGIVSCSDGKPLAGRASYMAQRDLLLPWLTVFDNVTLGPRLRRQPLDAQAAARARSLIAAVGLAEAEALRPDMLSGGMRQRAALARTLFEDRPVVLMDEPFSGVDAITRTRLQSLAAKLLRGRTVLLVTHDPLEALRLGHHIRVLSGAPATLSDALEPPGTPPRKVDDTRVLALQGTLLDRLAGAAP
jgi:putative hydroxymethylpyrimidine transport system ATP-binding protein